MDSYINISLNCSPFLSQELDLRVPTNLTFKELLQIISDTYGLGVHVINPCARNMQSGEIVTSTSRLQLLKDGTLLQLESI